MRIKFYQLPDYIGKRATITGPLGMVNGKKVRIIEDYRAKIEDPEDLMDGMTMPILWDDLIEIMGD
jgi:hypothetical protein